MEAHHAPRSPILPAMKWITQISRQTGFSEDVFEVLLYVQEGTVVHVLTRILAESTARHLVPKQSWPSGDHKHCYQCMCGRLVGINGMCVRMENLEHTSGIPCRFCLQRVPNYMCDKGMSDMIGNYPLEHWINVDSIRVGNFPPKP